jgi:hypothetical protein
VILGIFQKFAIIGYNLFMIPVMIIPVLSGYDKLQEMFDTIDYPIEHAIIIDNGGKLKSLQSNFVKEISIINMPCNLGISIPYNLGIKLTPMAKYWLFAQNDIKWISGGLEKINEISGSDYLCMAMQESRPFACRTIGENVVAKVGLLDESYFPAPGDENNYHKRCHYHGIEEKDISGTYIAENSSTIKEMLKNNSINSRVWNDNYLRSIFGPPINEGWNLSRRRSQDINKIDDISEINNIINGLNNNYEIHNKYEEYAFKQNIGKL